LKKELEKRDKEIEHLKKQQFKEIIDDDGTIYYYLYFIIFIQKIIFLKI
jgi:hypothetical protein